MRASAHGCGHLPNKNIHCSVVYSLLRPIKDRSCWRGFFVGVLVLAAGCPYPGQAQYFGQNKVSYRTIDFSTKESPHFTLYHYLHDSSANEILKEAEKWYALHSHFLQEELEKRNPLIIYNDHGDFQQTTVLNSTVPVGTGGFTEGLKNRVVMPLSEHAQKTSHVLGHELVHAFQYHMIKSAEGGGLISMQNLPLWLVEGMAEFMSLGRVDAHTSAWMRDAVLHDYFPSLRDLRNPQYFPYRYGQSFWAFLTGVWGDEIIKPFFLAALKGGVEKACEEVLGYNAYTVSKMWRETNINYYTPHLSNRARRGDLGEEVANKQAVGPLNILPAVSPDGRYMVTLSSRDVIAQDYILTDLENPSKIRNLGRVSRSQHIDFISSYESAAAWSPDSQKIALTVYKKGKNALIITAAKSGRIQDEFFIEDVPAFSHPSWSPDGRYIAVSGLREGQTDLYLVSSDGEKVIQLTDDPYSEIQPSWSPDGQQLVFSTDRPRAGGRVRSRALSLVVLAVGEGSSSGRHLELFRGANHHNARFVTEHKLLFLSDRDGTKNLYQYDLATDTLTMLTHYATGISGITEHAQAMDYCPGNETVFYSLYENRRYSVMKNSLRNLLYRPVEKGAVDQAAGTLPPSVPVKEERVTEAVVNFLGEEKAVSYQSKKYRPKFGLKNVSNSGVGVGVGSFGVGSVGGVVLQFDDILGNHEFLTLASVNGEIYDVGLGVNYLHKKNRVDWGVVVSHIPFLYRTYTLTTETIRRDGEDIEVENFSIYSLRTFEEQAILMLYYPLSISQRIEGSLFGRYYNYYYVRNNQYYRNNAFYRTERERIASPNSIYFWGFHTAWVGDKTSFGVVGPLRGFRYRLGVRENLGSLHFQEVNVDIRRYVWYRPLSFAWRVLHLGRYGPDAENRRFLYPLNVGLPQLVHGYNYLQAYNSSSFFRTGVAGGFSPSTLLGSRMAVGNVEVRLPLTGVKRLTLIEANFHTELAAFFDIGYAWSSDQYAEALFGEGVSHQRAPIVSTGATLRINLFGIILEPYYAIPFQRADVEVGAFGFNFLIPSW